MHGGHFADWGSWTPPTSQAGPAPRCWIPLRITPNRSSTLLSRLNCSRSPPLPPGGSKPNGTTSWTPSGRGPPRTWASLSGSWPTRSPSFRGARGQAHQPGQVEYWRRNHELALEAVRRGGHRKGEAVLLLGVGVLHAFQNHASEAREYLEQAKAAFATLTDCHGGIFVDVDFRPVSHLAGAAGAGPTLLSRGAGDGPRLYASLRPSHGGKQHRACLPPTRPP